MSWIKEYIINDTSFGKYWGFSTEFADGGEANFSWSSERSRRWNTVEDWSKDLVGVEGDVVVWTYTTPSWSDSTLWTTTKWTKES